MFVCVLYEANLEFWTFEQLEMLMFFIENLLIFKAGHDGLYFLATLALIVDTVLVA
jgi:hypothetical protein